MHSSHFEAEDDDRLRHRRPEHLALIIRDQKDRGWKQSRRRLSLSQINPESWNYYTCNVINRSRPTNCHIWTYPTWRDPRPEYPMQIMYVTGHKHKNPKQLALPKSTRRCERFRAMSIVSRPCSLVAARRALVLLDVLSPGGSNFHALPVEPLLTHVATYPKLVRGIILSTCPAQGIPMLLLIFLIHNLLLILCLHWLWKLSGFWRSLLLNGEETVNSTR